jgi:hypothetical protein
MYGCRIFSACSVVSLGVQGRSAFLQVLAAGVPQVHVRDFSGKFRVVFNSVMSINGGSSIVFSFG